MTSDPLAAMRIGVGRRWSSSRHPTAVDWGRGAENLMVNELAASVGTAAIRQLTDSSQPSTTGTDA